MASGTYVKFYLHRNFLGELPPDGGAVELDVLVVIAQDAVGDLLGLILDLGYVPDVLYLTLASSQLS
jgi:hypothetical protein